jgi:hypothetical protein
MGAAVARTLVGAVFTATLTEGSTALAASSVANVAENDVVDGDGIQAGSVVKDITGTIVTLDRPATADGTGVAVKVVRIAEKVDGNPYRLAVATASGITPDAAATLAAAQTQVPIGMRIDAYISDAPLLAEYTRQMSAVTATLATATLADVT